MQLNTQNMFRRMEELGISINRMSRELGTSSATVCAWKNNGSMPSASYVPAICRCLRMSYEQFFGQELPPPAPNEDVEQTNCDINSERLIKELNDVVQGLDARGLHAVLANAYAELDRINPRDSKESY